MAIPPKLEKPFFAVGQELTPEGDYSDINPTVFGSCPGYIYVKATPFPTVELTIAQIRKYERGVAALEITDSSRAGSVGTNKWGRIVYTLEHDQTTRTSCDYIQYFRSGEIEIVNGSYLRIIDVGAINLGYVVIKASKMLEIVKEWMERLSVEKWFVQVGLLGIEKKRLTTRNFASGPLIHQNEVSVRKWVKADSVLLLHKELEAALLAEAGL